MNLSVLIPTKWRAKKLSDCVKSIDVECRILILATEESDISQHVRDDKRVEIEINSSLTIVGAANHLAKKSTGHIQMFADDMVAEPGAIAKAVEILERVFNGDGVVGYAFSNMASNDDAITLIGRKYYESLPNGDLYYSGYEHFFSETEFGAKAKSVGKFIYAPECKLIHYHPVVTGAEDRTHKFRRDEKWINDYATYTRRNDSVACGRVFHG